nr:CoA-binding protein [Candidatus Njordarchaeota archaeon]
MKEYSQSASSTEKFDAIRTIFNPKSIAVIGASSVPITWGFWIAKNAVEGANRRRVFLVNPKSKQILGFKSYPSIRDIEDEVELAVIVVSADKVLPIIDECVAKDVKAVQIISGGFKEATEWGRNAQEKLTSIAHETGVRIQGPNCNGALNASTLINTSSAPNEFLKDSPIGFATQSGYIGNTFSYNVPATGISFGKYASTGNECDLTIIDFIEYFGQDPSIKVIMSYIEGVRNGERFKRTIEDVARRKPIVVFKVGEWESGSRAALSHTASIAGSYPVYKGLFKQIGVTQIWDLDMLPKIADDFVKYPLMKGRNVAVITIGAGWGVALSDSLPRAGTQIHEFSPELQAKIRKFVPSERASVRNPIDFGAGGLYDPVILSKLLELLLNENEVDAVVVSGIGEMAPIEPGSVDWEVALAERAYEDSLKYGKPIVYFTPLTRASSTSVERLIDKGIPVCHSISEVITMLGGLHHRWEFLETKSR